MGFFVLCLILYVYVGYGTCVSYLQVPPQVSGSPAVQQAASECSGSRDLLPLMSCAGSAGWKLDLAAWLLQSTATQATNCSRCATYLTQLLCRPAVVAGLCAHDHRHDRGERRACAHVPASSAMHMNVGPACSCPASAICQLLTDLETQGWPQTQVVRQWLQVTVASTYLTMPNNPKENLGIMQVWLQARKYTSFLASAARTSDCSMLGFTCLFCPTAQLQRCAALCVWEVHAPDGFSFPICCNSSSLAPSAT